MGMWVGSLELELLLGAVGSLKEKRSVVRPVVADLTRTFGVSAAEVDHQDLHRRTTVGVAVVSGARAHVVEVLDAVERRVAGRPEVELLTTHRVLARTDD